MADFTRWAETIDAVVADAVAPSHRERASNALAAQVAGFDDRRLAIPDKSMRWCVEDMAKRFLDHNPGSARAVVAAPAKNVRK